MYSTLVVHTSEVPRILALLNAPKPVAKDKPSVVPKRKRGRPSKSAPKTDGTN